MPHTKEGHYVPLPDFVTIGSSEIHGLGLFATKHIKCGVILGATHVLNDSRIENEYWIRTPLGGFYNHNEVNPTCKSVEENGIKYLKAVREIAAGEEITSCYKLYNPTS